jgi:hypothetical protein
MATTTATLSISSNVMSYPTVINKSMNMMKFQSCHGLEETSGLRTKKFIATAATVVVEQDEFEATKAAKVYMRNTSSDKAHFFYVAKHASAAALDTAAVTLGRLHGGDWMLIPYLADVNITVASSSTDPVTLEYMVFGTSA